MATAVGQRNRALLAHKQHHALAKQGERLRAVVQLRHGHQGIPETTQYRLLGDKHGGVLKFFGKAFCEAGSRAIGYWLAWL